MGLGSKLFCLLKLLEPEPLAKLDLELFIWLLKSKLVAELESKSMIDSKLIGELNLELCVYMLKLKLIAKLKSKRNLVLDSKLFYAKEKNVPMGGCRLVPLWMPAAIVLFLVFFNSTSAEIEKL